jgi:osmotically-inducible protein OsmY
MTDKQLHDEILAELELEPEIHPERIGVSVVDGVVTLTGPVETYSQKLAVERVVRRVYSASAVVDQLQVNLPSRDEVSDQELAHAAVDAIGGLPQVPPDTVRVMVREGHLVLEGTLDWPHQCAAVEAAVRQLQGVRGVTSHLRLTPPVAADAVQELVTLALRTQNLVEGDGITVEAIGGMVILRGKVPCARVRDEAEQAAWMAPGVKEVENWVSVAS